MAVTVIMQRFGGGQPRIKEVYSEGNIVTLDDNGHLLVKKSGTHAANTVAVYPPGSFVTAWVGDDPELTSAN